jgi:hypothetical protein
MFFVLDINMNLQKRIMNLFFFSHNYLMRFELLLSGVLFNNVEANFG